VQQSSQASIPSTPRPSPWNSRPRSDSLRQRFSLPSRRGGAEMGSSQLQILHNSLAAIDSDIRAVDQEELGTLLATECGKELFPGAWPPSA
jgi:hypothetical protein